MCGCPLGQWKWRRGLVYLSCSTYYGVVVVIAKAGAEAALLLGHEDQTSVFAASDDTDGTHIDTIQMADRTTILLRRGTTRTNTWYTHNPISFSLVEVRRVYPWLAMLRDHLTDTDAYQPSRLRTAERPTGLIVYRTAGAA